jgi:glycosidase
MRTHITKSIFFIFLMLALLTGIGGCSKDTAATASSSTAQQNPQGGVYYSLFVRSFADSDGDGIGDFNGIKQQLDYFSDLGIKGLWLLPIYPSPSYHGYDVDDYYDVNPQYGTMEDFEALIEACRQRGISVMLDITFNHSSSNNKWFIASKNPEDPHRAWYHWISENPANEMTDSASKYNINANVWGHKLWTKSGNSYYAGEFHDGMPDFNLDCQELREELKKVLKFWTEKGVSGFRFDAAGHIYDKVKMPADFTDSTKSSADFWKEMLDYLKSINPSTYNVAEVWDNTSVRAQSLAGLDSVFHFDMGDNYILKAVKEHSAGNNNLAHVLENDFVAYRKYNPGFIDAPFLTNHDQPRIAGNLKGDVASLKLAAGMYLLSQGVPFVYYGEEIGMMSGTKDETKRTPLLWGNGDRYETTWAAEADCVYNTNTVSVKDQLKDKNSLLNYYRKLINFRNATPAFDGKLSAFDFGTGAFSSWIMENGDEKVLVVHNVSLENQELSLPDGYSASPIFQGSPVKNSGDKKVSIPPQTTVVFKAN